MVSDGSTENAARRRAAAVAARRRLVAHLAAGGTTDMAKEVMEQPARVYTEPSHLALERERIFGCWPLIAGLSQDLASEGDLLVFEELGRSILLTRDGKGRLHGFLNMCAHRGARLVDTARDGTRLNRRRLSCGFHGWCYGLDGKLVAAPGVEGFDGGALDGRRLLPVPVAEWNGLLLVVPRPGAPAQSLENSFTPVAGPLSDLDLGRFRHIRTSTISARCNWKLAVDTYAENYHFGVLHGDSLGGAYVSNVTAFDSFGSHWRAHFPEAEMRTLVGRPESEWPDPVYRAVFFLFPNTVMVVGIAGPEKMLLRCYRIFPGPEVNSAICRMSVYSEADPADLPSGVFADEASSKVTLEDYEIAESAHANLEQAPEGYRVLFGRNEIGVQAFHRALAKALVGNGGGQSS